MNTEIQQGASRLLKQAGASGAFQLCRTYGGGNNRVHVLKDGGLWLLKEYFHHPDDPRDRLGTEFAFLTYLCDQGIRQIPKPYGQDRQLHLGLYEYIDGSAPEPDSLTDKDIVQAASFIKSINAQREKAVNLLPSASEAWFTLADHLSGIERRLNRLHQHMTIEDELDRAAGEFVAGSLTKAWQRVKEEICENTAGRLMEELPLVDRCLSPSDFGFHNAFRTEKGLVFYDFEYAGWDDPAKLVCDFFCQVKVPVPMMYFSSILESATELVQDKEWLERRIRYLLPAYRIKWCCIVLNEFLPVSRQRRQFARVDNISRQRQLERACQQLNAIWDGVI